MSGRPSSAERQARRGVRRRRSRRAIAVLLVLLLISTTLALSYAILRSQGTTAQVQSNADLRLSARQAALSGIAVGLKTMHDGSSWGGVGSVLTGTLQTNCTFKVAFSTGDPSLTSSSSDYANYPYRVTLLSTGTASDAADANRQATYRVRVVVRLVPRKLPNEPSQWSSMTSNTVYQYSADGDVRLAVPCRIVGTICSFGTWTFPAWCYWSSTVQTHYLNDLNLMRLAGMTDCRPFNSSIALPYSKQPTGLVTTIRTALGITTSDLTTSPPSDWVFPGEVTSYRLYPGGKEYSVPSVSHSLSSTTLTPDPLTNPLGVYYHTGELDLAGSVTVQGTLLVNASKLVFSGKNVQITPVDLPAVYPGTEPVQLPVVLVHQDFRIEAGATGSITGLVATWRRFDVAADYQGNSSVTTACRVVAQSFRIRALNEWRFVTEGVWDWFYSLYSLQTSTGYKYFPSWLKAVWGLDYSPRIVIQPDTRTINYHYPWLDTSSPLYAVHPDDGGLRWELVDWTDNPSN